MTLRKKFSFVEMTDVGRVREHNEDDIGSDPDIGLWVLADGMGGYNAGEVASGIAVKTTIDLVTEACRRENRADAEPETGYMRQTISLRDAIMRANKIIHQTAQSQPQCEGMGTTLVACLFFDNRISIAHVGDSRLYRMRDNRFEQITMDHSFTTGTCRSRILLAGRGPALDQPQLRDPRAGCRTQRRGRNSRS
jgi:serine/threonine protein phosphatase PrpC